MKTEMERVRRMRGVMEMLSEGERCGVARREEFLSSD